MTSLALSFNNVNFTPVQQDGQVWLTSAELAKGLSYSDTRSVTKIFNRYSDEFNEKMTRVIEMPEVVNLGTSNLINKVRIFSLRGCHLIAMFSRTTVAKQFRRWVLDILDKEVSQPVAKTHKSERTPLHDAHAMLVAKTKHLNSSDAWKIINQRFGTNSIDEIPYDAIPVAVEYIHHLIALYSNANKQAGLFDNETYELVREFAESVLSQNFMMQDVWQALMLINKRDMMYYSKYVIDSNTLARKVSIALDFKTKKGEPLVDGFCQAINFVGGTKFTGVNPKWFSA